MQVFVNWLRVGTPTVITVTIPGQTIFSVSLTSCNWTELTERDIKQIEIAIKSDGCSGPTVPLFRNGCVLHDFWYRTHRDFDGTDISREMADQRFREYIKVHDTLFDGVSPMAYWRWAMLRLFGEAAWDHDERGTPLHEYPKLYAMKCDSGQA